MKLVKLAALLLLPLLMACVPGSGAIDRPGGRAAGYDDPGANSELAGIGIESRDLVAMTDRMVRDMLANPILAGRQPSARVVLDAEYFRNESSSRIDKNLITDRMRIELNRAAAGRMIFLGRHYGDMVSAERQAKRDGQLTQGTLGMAAAQAGADFRLGGRIASQDAVRASAGMVSRFHQIIFEMVDLETGIIVWSDMYDFKKTAQDDVVYR